MNISDLEGLDPNLEDLTIREKKTLSSIHEEARKKALVDLNQIRDCGAKYADKLNRILLLSGWKSSISREGRVCKATMEDLKETMPDLIGLPLAFFTTKPSSAYLTETLEYLNTTLEELSVEVKQDKEALLDLMKAEISHFRDNYNELYSGVLDKLTASIQSNPTVQEINSDEYLIMYKDGETMSLVNTSFSHIASVVPDQLMDPPGSLTEMLPCYSSLSSCFSTLRNYITKRPNTNYAGYAPDSIKGFYFSVVARVDSDDMLKVVVDRLYSLLIGTDIVSSDGLFSSTLDTYLSVMKARYDMLLAAACLNTIYTKLSSI